MAKWGLVPLILFVFGVLLSLRYIQTSSGLTILLHNHDARSIKSIDYGELLGGDKIRGEFTAEDDNLGIVAVRFNTFFRINEDIVIFRIKEAGAKNWFSENRYTTPQFQPNKLFTFGFPIIENSENKVYQFEIESTQGQRLNAVALSPIEPVFVSKYQYLRASILSDRDYMLRFIDRKFFNTVTDLDSLVSFISFSLPFVLYIITILFFDRYLSGKYYIILLPIVVMVFLSIINNTRNDGAVIGFTFFWIYLCFVYRLESSYSYLLGVLFIIASSFLYYFNGAILSRNLIMWAFMLLTGGIILQVFESIIKQEDLKTIPSSALIRWFKKRSGKWIN